MNEKIAVLSKAVWNYQDIMEWAGVKKGAAYKYLRRAQKENGGLVPVGVGYAKTDSVLKLFGTSRKEELETYAIIEK